MTAQSTLVPHRNALRGTEVHQRKTRRVLTVSARWIRRRHSYHLTAASDDETHHFAEEAGLQRVEIIIRLKECVDGVEKWVGRHQHLGDLIHVRRYQVTRNVRIPATTVAHNAITEIASLISVTSFSSVEISAFLISSRVLHNTTDMIRSEKFHKLTLSRHEQCINNNFKQLSHSKRQFSQQITTVCFTILICSYLWYFSQSSTIRLR